MNRNRLLGLLSRYALGRKPEVSLIGRFSIRVEEVEIQFLGAARIMLYVSYTARLVAQELMRSTHITYKGFTIDSYILEDL